MEFLCDEKQVWEKERIQFYFNYLNFSASLLQISLAHSVYLLDLDALHGHEAFLDFIDRFFMSTEIVKIGYQFSEDLVQMRQRLPNCIGLYRPANIYCIGKLVDEVKIE